jgi:hypothetical protein
MIPYSSLDDLFKMKALEKQSKEEDDIWDVQLWPYFFKPSCKGEKIE